jgi:hypothetical protein
MAGSDAGLAFERELSKLQPSPHWLYMEVPSSPQPRYLHPSTQRYRRSAPPSNEEEELDGRTSKKVLEAVSCLGRVYKNKGCFHSHAFSPCPLLLYNTS